jgi:hypothetical protein
MYYLADIDPPDHYQPDAPSYVDVVWINATTKGSMYWCCGFWADWLSVDKLHYSVKDRVLEAIDIMGLT